MMNLYGPNNTKQQKHVHIWRDAQALTTPKY